ncbi:endolytic transglycosylase MltG [Arthrobacter sp. BF1]|uniref:endolytic transglycosylase MltG n=1 Tax=Arthrobacter sp. BF1 TaxID=2821145 RepID=UPI001C4EA1D0|nr:endolytic transglycosylase MltG [Arthrobacter sp. BF1]
MSDLFRDRSGRRSSDAQYGQQPGQPGQPAQYDDEQAAGETYWPDGSEDTAYTGHSDYEHYEEHGQHPSFEHVEAEHVEAEHVEAEAAALPSRRNSRVSKRVRKRRRTAVFLVILVLFGAVVFFAVQAVKPMLGGFTVPDYPGPGTGTVKIVVPEGATGRTVASDLKANDVVASEQSFLDALSAADGSGSLQPGDFTMKNQMKASDAVAVLLAVSDSKVHYAAVPQNLRINEVMAELAKSTGIPVAEFTKLANQPALFGLPAKAKNLEGYLAPGEYRFPLEYDAKEILSEMVGNTMKALTETGVTDPVEQFRILTVASIIEFEGNEANYAKISGAIENRINNPNGETGGRLESDATVAYGLGLITYNITAAQKADASNLYNTFANPGLPVGPIGSPAVKAIIAAAHPEKNPYYFWVTVNLKTGETLYAATFAEHQVNVAKYVAWCDDNPGACD